jgi:hypothetical protein
MAKSNEGNIGCIIIAIIGYALYSGFNYVSDYFTEKQNKEENAIKYQSLIKKNSERDYITFLIESDTYKSESDRFYSEKIDSVLWINNLKNRTFQNYINLQDTLSYNYTLKNIDIAKDSLDNMLWKEALINKDFDTYLKKTYGLFKKFESGKFKLEAEKIIKKNDSLIWSSEIIAWAEAQKRDNSATYNKFLEYFPKSKNYEKAKLNAIQKEVDEIFNDDKTGRLPESEFRNKNNSKYSEVTISNDTGCELIVRYSGQSVRKFIIDVGETKTFSLYSGEYRVAASACGSNYAGSENLSGNYSSKFYIRTVRY